MKCLSCGNPVETKTARLWERRILTCMPCAELADKELAELKIALKRAEAMAIMFLEQRILRGELLNKTSGTELPGLGLPPQYLDAAMPGVKDA